LLFFEIFSCQLYLLNGIVKGVTIELQRKISETRNNRRNPGQKWGQVLKYHFLANPCLITLLTVG